MLVSGILLLVAGLLVVGARPGTDAAGQRELQALRERSGEQDARGGAARRARPALCGELARRTLGSVRDDSLVELSGLVQSRARRDVLWAIQDSGAAAEFVALRPDGRTVGRWAVAGAQNVDWEDLATGPGPGGVPWLYGADIGDNLKRRDGVTIYRVAEPGDPSGGGTLGPAQALTLTYPDGPHDAEVFLVDPLRGTLVVVTKGVPGGTYVAAAPASWTGTLRLRRIGDAAVAYATGGDVSADGRVIAVRGYFNVALYARRGREPLTTTMRRSPCTSPTPLDDGQGEAIALARNGRSAWIVAEGARPPIRRLTPR